MRRKPILYLVIFIVYLLITLLMTYPVIVQLSTHLVGFGDDAWVHYWNGWWVKRVLAEGGSLYSTRLLFYPQTTSLVYHNFGWTNIAGWLALEPFIGGIAAYNLVYLANVALSAFTMFLLARYLLKSNGPAFIAGLVHGFWPYRFLGYSHPNLISTQWLILVVFFTIKLIRERGRLRHALCLGVSMALTGLSRWQMLIPTSLAVSVYLAFSFFEKRERWSWRTVGMLSLAAFVALVLVAPAFYPVARDLVLRDSEASPNLDKPVGTETDLISFIVPPINHPLAPLFDGLEYTRWRISKTMEIPKRIPNSHFLGYAVLALVILAIVWRRSETRLWIVLALIAFLIALGPELRIDRHSYPAIPMPSRLIGGTLPMRIMRKPHRFSVLLALPMAMLAAHGAIVLKERLGQRRSMELWGLLSLLVLFDYLSLPAETISTQVPAFYRTLGDEPGDFAIAGLPGDRQNAETYMFYQTVHGHPLMTGHISRLPSNALDFVSSVPLVKAVYFSGKVNTKLPDVSRQLSLLADAGFRYLVLHKEFASPDQLTEWRSYLVASPCYEDDEVVVYSTTPVAGQDFSLKYRLGTGIGLIEADLSTETVSPEAVLELQVIWGTVAPSESDFAVEVALVDEDGKKEQAKQFAVSPDWPTGEWPANAIVRDAYALQIDPWLEDGVHKVTATLVREGNGETAGDSVEIGEVVMSAPERRFNAPAMSRTVDATFSAPSGASEQPVLRLLGYDLEVREDTAQITLHWRALRRMSVLYKFFIHLYEQESGKLASQVDWMPRDWAYPTTWWEVGEIVSDEVDLSLKDIAPGSYRLGVGVYHPDTGERLNISDAPADFTAWKDRLTLPEEIIR